LLVTEVTHEATMLIERQTEYLFAGLKKSVKDWTELQTVTNVVPTLAGMIEVLERVSVTDDIKLDD